MNKNLFLFAAAAALTFTACSDNDDMTSGNNGTLSSNENSAVQFSTYLAGTQTRATSGKTGIITNSDPTTGGSELKTVGFGVFAYSTGTSDLYTSGTWKSEQTPDFMYNQKVTWSSGNSFWTYTPVKFWPNAFNNGSVDDAQGVNGEENKATGSETSGKVSFFAYAPYVDLSDADYTTSATTTDVPTTLAFDGKNYGTGKYVKTADATETALKDNNGIIALTSNTTANEPLVYYGLISPSYKSDVDLLWGQKLKNSYTGADNQTKDITGNYNVNITKQAVNETVGFSFKHALAKLGGNTDNGTGTTTVGNNSKVKVILDLDNGSYDGGTKGSDAITGGTKEAATLVTVKSIDIQDWKSYSNGSTTYNGQNVEVNNIRKFGWFNIATGKWSDYDKTTEGVTPTDADKYESHIDGGSDANHYALNSEIAEPSSFSATYSSTGWSDASLTGVTTTAKEAYAAITTGNEGKNQDEGIVVIPGGEDLQLVVTVDYYVRTGDTHLSKTYSEAEQKITNLVTIPAKGLTANKVYSLIIHLGLTSVKFSAEVGKWEDGTDNDPDTPGENNENTTGNKDIYLPSNTLAATSVTSTSDDVEALNGTATVDLTGLSDGATVELVSAKDASDADVDGVTVTLGSITDGAATATISVPDNTGTARTIKVVFKVKNKQGTVIQEATVTINQKANS